MQFNQYFDFNHKIITYPIISLFIYQIIISFLSRKKGVLPPIGKLIVYSDYIDYVVCLHNVTADHYLDVIRRLLESQSKGKHMSDNYI